MRKVGYGIDRFHWSVAILSHLEFNVSVYPALLFRGYSQSRSFRQYFIIGVPHTFASYIRNLKFSKFYRGICTIYFSGQTAK